MQLNIIMTNKQTKNKKDEYKQQTTLDKIKDWTKHIFQIGGNHT